MQWSGSCGSVHKVMADNKKKFIDLGGHTVEILARVESGHWAALAFVHGTKTSVRGALVDLGTCREAFVRSLAASAVDPVDTDDYDDACAQIDDLLGGMIDS